MQNRRLSRRQFLAGTGLDGCWPGRRGMRAQGRTRAHCGSCRSDCGARRNRCACGRHGCEGRTGPRYDRRPDRLRRRRALSVRPGQPGRPRHAGSAGAAQGQEAREARLHGHHRRDRALECAVAHRPVADRSVRSSRKSPASSWRSSASAPDDQFTKIIQDATTKAGGYDVYSFWLPDKGSLSEAGASARLDDFVGKYKPEWDKYYTGGKNTVQQFNYHAGKCVLRQLRRRLPELDLPHRPVRGSDGAEGLQGASTAGTCSGPRPGSSSTRSPSSSTAPTRA